MPASWFAPAESSRKTFAGYLRGLDSAGVRRTFNSWASMLDRCLIPGHTSEANYHLRGITVCERWLLFSDFISDMGLRPIGKTLDRIDNDGDYETNNCRWSTPKEQASNTRRTKRVGGLIQREAAKLAGVHESTLSRRLQRGHTDQEAMSPSFLIDNGKKLCRRDVESIREIATENRWSRAEIAQRYGVSVTTINSIVREATWAAQAADASPQDDLQRAFIHLNRGGA